MRKLIIFLVVGILWCNIAYSQDCQNIDYKNFADEFINCIKKNKKEEVLRKNMINALNPTIDFECLNLCKATVKGTFTIEELNLFCMRQCALK